MANGGVATRLRARAAGGSAQFDGGHTPHDGGPVGTHRRRPPPGGRAVAGGLLVAVATVGLFAAASRAGSPDRSYAVARKPLAAGTRLTADDLALEPLSLPAALRRRAFDDRERLIGTILVAPLGAGELIQASAVVTGRPANATPEMSFRVEAGAMAATLRPGEPIDVFATYGAGSEAVTAVVVRDAAITSLDRAPGVVTDGSTTLTVSLGSDHDALALAHAVTLGRVTVVRSSGTPDPPGPPPTYRGPGRGPVPSGR